MDAGLTFTYYWRTNDPRWTRLAASWRRVKRLAEIIKFLTTETVILLCQGSWDPERILTASSRVTWGHNVHRINAWNERPFCPSAHLKVARPMGKTETEFWTLLRMHSHVTSWANQFQRAGVLKYSLSLCLKNLPLFLNLNSVDGNTRNVVLF